MAAGLGFKTFTTGEVLTAADTNGYLMQGINVFASTAARDAAITSPQEGQFAFTKDTNGLWYYDGAAWVASGATGDIEGVTAGIGISGGGTSGTVTVTNSMATAIDAKGDLVPGTGADTFARLAVGANGTVLTADSAEATGLKWATPAGGGANWSLLNSGGTTLSGAATVTVSGISSKDKIMVILSGASSSSTGDIGIRLNTDSTSIYYNYGTVVQAQSTYAVSIFQATAGADSRIKMGSSPAANVINGSVTITGCNASGVKQFIATSGTDNATNGYSFSVQGYVDLSATITSISVNAAAGNLDNGTVFVYTSAS